MEATSARYAARDRFAYPTQPAETQLQRFIQNACSPENFEPNLALSLEIADVINAKKGGAPREAAVAIVGYINHRNPNVSLLALSLLDICVKNCGYPFHLQISTKDFLNELVRRFPERPPIRTTRVQNKILELVEEWRQTICETSKYKEDLGFVRDMHRLLTYKGYVFPQIRREDAAVLNPSDNLKSADEMEQEERAAQSAKLQELIRRGTPRDLQEANKLMKVMAGYDQRNKTDYRAKAAQEVSEVQEKAKILEDMLQGYKPGDEIQEGDVFEELANALASAHPKIQKMCEEESEDTEAVAKLLEINDSIHRTIERYKLVKKGDLAAANAIPRGTLGVTGAGVRKGPDNELSLIDFGGLEEGEGEEGQATAPSAAGQDLMSGGAQSGMGSAKAKGNALEDDLLGLTMGDGSIGQEGGVSLGAGPSSSSSSSSTNGTADIMAQFSQPSRPTTRQPQAAHSIFSSSSSSTAPPAQGAHYDLFGSLSTPGAVGSRSASSKPATPIPSALQSQQQQAAKRSSADPFAALAATSTPPRQASPFQFQQATRAASQQSAAHPSSGAVDLLGGPIPTGPSNGTSSATAPVAPAAAAADDEWTFSSSVPADDQPSDLTVTNSTIRTVFSVKRENDTEVILQSRISNNTPQPINDLTFQLAVTKPLPGAEPTGRDHADDKVKGGAEGGGDEGQVEVAGELFCRWGAGGEE
ncbi:ARF-binding protein [Recurvomyces mirabilis]|uniref:ARF-binding protein n=1 Tax=Recurvomyces mirabilis TaxID=574656 RepID=A0AAE1C422_9PEZI|nr:ARF-binding protein [Recurvomyces mirabilis]KAK5159542.1 ARF-binding protein [Recurvomyces mirabilis]